MNAICGPVCTGADLKQYIPLEDNRRVAVLAFLTQPEVMTSLDMPDGMKRIFERLASGFDRSKVEPISCYEVEARDEGRYLLLVAPNQLRTQTRMSGLDTENVMTRPPGH